MKPLLRHVGTFLTAFVFMLLLFGATQSAIGAPQEQSASPTPSSLSFPIHAPWPAGITLHAGGDGSYYNDCNYVKKWHCDKDAYALDFNGKGDQVEKNDAGMIVLSVSDGIVTKAECLTQGYGCYVVINHRDGYQSRYAHLRQEPFVKENERIPQGTPLGYVGKTGTEGEHLHFAIYHCDPHRIVNGQCGENNKFLRPVKPEPLDGHTNIRDGEQILSENYGVGYDAYQDYYDASKLHRHSSFINTYWLLGGEPVLGLSSSPVNKWGSTNYIFQEFKPLYSSTPSAQRSALVGDDKSAFYIHEIIWDKYKQEGGPSSALGMPLSHSYDYYVTGYSGQKAHYVRSDFKNGSIVGDTYNNRTEIINSHNADWRARIYSDWQFKNLILERYDKYIDFEWQPLPMSSQIRPGYLGSSAIWSGKIGGFISFYRIDAQVQGHLQILVNSREVLKIDSPDEVTIGRSTQIGFLEDDIEIRFWQEPHKTARIYITSHDLIRLVGTVRAFESEGTIYYEQPSAPPGDFPSYEPPPFPGSAVLPPPPRPNPTAQTSTVLVMDISGSMRDYWQGGVKIESAKAAANQILNMLEQDGQIGLTKHRVGLVSFSYDAFINLDLTSDINQARSNLSTIMPLASTNIGAGLEAANDLLSHAAPDESKIIILLSDGLSNVGLSPNEILSGPVQDAAHAGSCIYTVGFGDPGDLDETLLQEIAQNSGCGQYYYATNIAELEKAYIKIRHESIGKILAVFSGNISEGQTVQAGAFTVPPSQGELAVSLHWPGSRMQLILHDPSGAIIAQDSANVKLVEYPNMVYALISKPMAGSWLVDVVGREVPKLNEQYYVIISSRTAPTTQTSPTSTPGKDEKGNGGGGMGIVFILIALSMGGVWIYVTNQRRRPARTAGMLKQIARQKPSGQAALRVLFGAFTGQIIVLGQSSLLIGRSRMCNIVLADPTVSRQHARLQFMNGYWYLQDQNSKTGVFVNGQRVNAIALRPGDQIRIGETVFEFRLT
ncbi:MAG: FHA domain-containing protein [Anaerolineales bacterium]|nr:FHA domain-containing protein [Anaerolineales bacterium]